MKRSEHELRAEDLRREFDPASYGTETTECLAPLEGIIGQKRAVQALKFGLGIQENGYNIYVAGPPGIGKMTAVKAYLESHAGEKETPPDWCYVNNFDDPYMPESLRLPPGRGRMLQHDMKELIEHLRRDVRRAFESDEYGSRRQTILKEFERRRTQLREKLNGTAEKAGFALEGTPLGLAMLPILEGRPLKESEFQALPPETRETIQKRREALQEQIGDAMKEMRGIERSARKRMQKLDEEVALYAVSGPMTDLTESYKDLPDVLGYIEAVQKEILENIEMFKATPGDGGGNTAEIAAAAMQLDDLFRKFEVNLLVDNSRSTGAPVVLELNPSHNALFGRVEKETKFGALQTDFTMIKAGSLHRANGGYLVLPMEDVLKNLGSWEGLKRSLRAGEVQIEELGERLGFIAVKSLKPKPMPLDLKVVLVGRTLYYHLLHSYDEEFPELFKVKAEFDTRTDFNDDSVRDYLSFICTYSTQRSLKKPDGSALARMLEYVMRLADDKEKLSTHFGALADLICESNYWAVREEAAQITADHVRKALDEKVYRSSLVKERIQEMIERGMLLIETQGEAVGQVNGLSVLSLGDYAFGKPSRITASVGPGRGNIVDIEREVELGGPTHSKGVMILSGYLARHFAGEKPLALSARLVFEQSYEGVDGDSASSAELYSILSALSGAPIRQAIAVTGSVNQRGEVQAIGGVNQKVEGYFEVCRARGLSGEQGVMIPKSNVSNLMLREEVVEAVREGRFHLWAVASIDEGIEVLTGVPAGRRDAKGVFPAESIHGRVDRRLEGFRKALRREAPKPAPPRS
ncbi:MAG TPA: ATP-binding protein [Candidatus Saccharimonadales bacterium]|nr:ATP-binding protein [Candidatus Saccharimonadales bacterium]